MPVPDTGPGRSLLLTVHRHLGIRTGEGTEPPPTVTFEDATLRRLVSAMAAARDPVHTPMPSFDDPEGDGSALWLSATLTVGALYVPHPPAIRALRHVLRAARSRDWTGIATQAAQTLAMVDAREGRGEAAVAMLDAVGTEPFQRSLFEHHTRTHVHILAGQLEQALEATGPWLECAQRRANSTHVQNGWYNRLVLWFALERDDELARACEADPPAGNWADVVELLGGWLRGERPDDDALGPFAPFARAALGNGPQPEPLPPSWDAASVLLSETILRRWHLTP